MVTHFGLISALWLGTSDLGLTLHRLESPRTASIQPADSYELTAIPLGVEPPAGAPETSHRTFKASAGWIAGTTTFKPTDTRNGLSAMTTLWMHSRGLNSTIAKPDNDLIHILGVSKDGAVWGTRNSQAVVWKDDVVIRLPGAISNVREGNPWAVVAGRILPSGAICASVERHHKEDVGRSAYLLVGGRPVWLGLTGGEFSPPDSSSIFSTLFGERPDGALVGSSKYFRKTKRDAEFAEAGGWWRGDRAWVYKNGACTPLEPEFKDHNGDCDTVPLMVLKTGDIIVAIPGGFGRAVDTTIKPSLFPGMKPRSVIACHHASDDGRFLVLSTTFAKDDAVYWLADGEKVTRITPPAANILGSRNGKHFPLRVSSTGTVAFTSRFFAESPNYGGTTPWIWKDGKAIPLVPNGSRGPRFEGEVLRDPTSRSGRYIGGDIETRIKVAGSKPVETRRAWLYDLELNQEISLVVSAGTETDRGSSIQGISASGVVILRCTMNGTDKRTFVWSADQGLRPVVIRPVGETAVPNAYVALVYGFASVEGTQIIASVDGLPPKENGSRNTDYLLSP